MQNSAAAGDGPDVVEIDTLTQLFQPVNFNHAMHEEVTENKCAVCHHHTLGTPIEDANCLRCHAESGPADEVSCQGCHSSKRFDAEYLNEINADNRLYHRDKVGLKAAYHLRCMSCHEKMGVSNECQDCHERTDAGDRFFHSGQYAPKPSDRPASEEH
jgi:hypothetical protein